MQEPVHPTGAAMPSGRHNKKTRVADAGLLPFVFSGDLKLLHAASVFSTSLIQYEVPYTIASSLKL